MTLIIVFFAIVFLILGYYLMDKVDKFIENNILPRTQFQNDECSSENEYKKKVILIYGDNELTRLVKTYCESENYAYEEISEIDHIKADNRYICLLALSHNDADNLMIGSVGLKVYCISPIIALCNNHSNLKLYNEFNFDKVLVQNGKIDSIFNVLRKFVESAVKD